MKSIWSKSRKLKNQFSLKKCSIVFLLVFLATTFSFNLYAEQADFSLKKLSSTILELRSSEIFPFLAEDYPLSKSESKVNLINEFNFLAELQKDTKKIYSRNLTPIPKYLNIDFNLLTSEYNLPATFELLRMDSEAKSRREQLFRAKLSFDLKPFKSKYEILNFRFKKDLADYTWIYSPLTEQVRRHYSDANEIGILASSFASTDFFMLGKNLSLYDEIDSKLIKTQVPFFEQSFANRKEQNCDTNRLILNNKLSNQVLLSEVELIRSERVNYELLKTEFKLVTYYYSNGIDFLTFYYDYNEKLTKLLINYLNTEGLPVKTKLYNFNTKTVDTLNVLKLTSCTKLPQEVVIKDFDPNSLGKQP